MRTTKRYNNLEKNKGGFSLIEIIVVMSFFVILTSVVMFKYKDFDDTVVLDNQVLDIALTIREAQVRALSSQQAPGGTVILSGDFRYAYGVHFDKTWDTNSFALYVDKDPSDSKNHWFDDGDFACNNSAEECVRKTTLSAGYFISAICTTDSSIESCTAINASVSFQRPRLDGIILTVASGSEHESFRLEVTSPNNQKKSVRVTKAGQIYVE